ncbi:MAG TPA: NHL repeat-containing protein, partial [Verrucomicrobiae bacterium]|nr:NHL repeat-containing protein [Verrucomicrobiae bacterium]
TPKGLALDGSGDLFVADYGNNVIRELSDIGGANNGFTITYATNHINAPVGVVIDGSDNMFVLNRGSTAAFSTNGSVVEYDMYGLLIATNATHLTNAAAIALDPAGNIYVTERTNLVIRISGGSVTNVATVTASNALLQGVAVLPSGLLAVCDSRRNGIYTIDPNTGIWTTNAGFNGPGDGTGPNNVGIPNSMAQFLSPYGVAAAGDGTLIVSDYGNDRVKVVTAAGITTNFYGVSSNDWVAAGPPYQDPGWVDGTVSEPEEPAGVAGRSPAGVLLSPDGTTVYTTEDYYHLVRKTTGTAFATIAQAPGVPIGLSAVVRTNSLGQLVVVLTWSPVSTGNVTNYLIERPASSIIGQTNGTTFTDTTVTPGNTYTYVIQAANSGGLSGDSAQVTVVTPILPPATPIIGWFDYEFNPLSDEYLSVFHPITNGVYSTANDLAYTVVSQGGTTYYNSGPPPLSGEPTNNLIPGFISGQLPGSQTPLIVPVISNLVIEAVSKAVNPADASVSYSSIASVTITYQCAPPTLINATNAAAFFVSDLTTNVTYFYTTDGTDPLTNQIPSQEIAGTNTVMPVGLNISSNFVFSIRAFRGGYLPSPLVTASFLSQNFQANELTWGFASGYCSSSFVGSPGELFYAPVTLTTLPNTAMYGLDFDMTVTNLGPDPVPTGAYSFQPMILEPESVSNSDVSVLAPIPPYIFIGEYSGTPAPGQVINYNGTNFISLEAANTTLNELAVGWFEMYGRTNLYNTLKQNLLTYSSAFIDELPNSEHPNGVIVGGYAFQIPTNAQPGEQYEIQLQRPSADNNGLGGENSAVIINTPTSGSLSNGPINGIKIVTVGQPKYLAGDVYPFEWFNAGNFGNGDLITYSANDIQEVFDAAIYGINTPPPGSDLYDAMDSAGGFGAYDADAGYWTNANITANSAQRNALFNVNDDTTINEMAFGDGNLDVCDVYVTFLRSQFPELYWFQRFYTNDTVHGVFGRVAQAIVTQTNVNEGGASPGGGSAGGGSSPVSITNTPTVHFAAGDYLASAGQSLSIPITASVYGLNPLRMLMFNVNVTPLDGSPALTTPVTFSPNAPFNNSSIYNGGFETNTTANCAEAFLPTTFPISSSANVTGSNVIGYLHITIPANATSASAYALSFGHASASPNGLVSFPKTTYTGLITLSSRTNSTYGDVIPDSWRLRYFGTVNNQLSVSNADADGTGMNNWQKYLAGLDPNDPTSVLKAGTDQSMAQNAQDMVLYWPSVNGQTYIIKRSPTLFPGQWTAISTNIGDGTYMEIHDTSGGPNRYYEVTTP